jgi:hypothetical protein
MCFKCNNTGKFQDGGRQYVHLWSSDGSGKLNNTFACNCGCPERCKHDDSTDTRQYANAEQQVIPSPTCGNLMLHQARVSDSLERSLDENADVWRELAQS